MRRREFIGAISGAALVLPCGAGAQQAGKVWRIGIVVPGTGEQHEFSVQALEQRLAELGYVQGRNIVLLQRLTEPRPGKLEDAVASLAPQVDLLVVGGSIAAMAAKKLASDVPIVFIQSAYPVEIGLVNSLAHPGGNITGIASEAAAETNQKRLQILTEVVPDLQRAAVLRVPAEPFTRLAMPSLELAARQLGVSHIPVDIKSADDLEAAFASMKQRDAQALLVLGAVLVRGLVKRTADLALAARLPSCHVFKEAVIAGGLVSFGPDLAANFRPAAAQIDKIIKGMSPADIPVEQPTRYELTINLKTACLLNLTIPPALLARADEVIE
jgi:putative tryptophan/tyrosine transport system substrate-binding protein